VLDWSSGPRLDELLIIGSAGVVQMPETTFQANRAVAPEIYLNLGETTDLGGGPRQYGFHVDLFMSENGSWPLEREARAFSYDVGTNVTNLTQDVRGIKGRMYATGGSANLRGIYSVMDVAAGSGFTGELTAYLATVYKNGEAANESVGYRSNMSDGTTAAYEAAGTGKAGENGEMSFAYRVRGGSGQPGMPTGASFATHGGGSAPDMYVGFKDNLNQTSADRVFRVKKDGQIQGTCFSSLRVSIADDAVATIVAPTPSGLVKIYAETTLGGWIEIYYRVQTTVGIETVYAGSRMETGTGIPTGTTGTDGQIGVYAHTDGNIYVENRFGAAKDFVVIFDASTSL
jgi:hypothetical protein